MSDQLLYPQIRRAITGELWSILPEKMDEILDFLAFKTLGGEFTTEELSERLGAASAAKRQRGESSGSIAVMPVLGTLSNRMNMLTASSGGTSYEAMTKQVRALVNDPDISAIVLDIDSPGGAVNGADELAAEIYRARSMKPITAVANSLMASAAYWIGASASEIVVSPSAEVGSIGVLGGHRDESALHEKLGVKMSLISAGKYKAENNPFEPITDEGRASLQKRVDEAYGRFTRAVAKGRGVGVDAVRNGFGEGRVVSAREAVSLGMADRIATIDEVIATMPTKREAGTSAVSAGLVAVSYKDHGQRVLADLNQFIQATRDRVEFRRAERGDTPLSATERERLTEIDQLLIEASAEVRSLYAETDPNKREKAQSAYLLGLRGRLRDVDLLMADIAD